ncbi:hypothetical protein D3C81_1466250 [compost metagenome]
MNDVQAPARVMSRYCISTVTDRLFRSPFPPTCTRPCGKKMSQAMRQVVVPAGHAGNGPDQSPSCVDPSSLRTAAEVVRASNPGQVVSFSPATSIRSTVIDAVLAAVIR